MGLVVVVMVVALAEEGLAEKVDLDWDLAVAARGGLEAGVGEGLVEEEVMKVEAVTEAAADWGLVVVGTVATAVVGREAVVMVV